MVLRPNRVQRIVLAICAALASSALWFFGTGLHTIWPLTWIAPIPVFLIAGRVGAGQAFALSALAYFTGELNLWHYLHDVFGAPLAITLAALLIPSLAFGLVVVTYRSFLLSGSLWKAALAASTAWVTFEYLTAATSPHCTFGNLGYSQMDFLPILQIVSVTGIWGLGFLLLLFAATVAASLSGLGRRSEQKRLLAVVSGVLIAVLLFGWWRLASGPAAEHAVSVALLSTDVREKLFAMKDEAALQVLRDYSDRVRTLAGQHAGREESIVVLPEKIALVSDEATGRIDALFQETARLVQSTVVVGLDRGSRTKRFNEARAYSPDGALTAVYDKHHMIPGFEDVDQPGTARTIWRQASGVWGIQICKDMDFPKLSRQYGRDGVGLLLVPAWDFRLDGWLHGRMAILRGVESGFTIARAAKQGFLTISDNRGRVLAEQSSGAAPFSVLMASAPVAHEDTFYSRMSDWFPWLSIAALAALLVERGFRRTGKALAAAAERPVTVRG